MKRREFTLRLTAASVALPLGRVAFAQGTPVEGQQYKKLDAPAPTAPPAGKVEVVEFFTYACPHCFEFEPVIENWTGQHPAGIEFRRVPVPFMWNAENFQKLYYSLEALKLVDTMQLKVFNAVHLEHQRLTKPEEIGALMARNGVDAAKFLSVFNSFSVGAKLQQAKQLTEAYRVDSMPTLGIGGRYITSPGLAGSREAALQVAEFVARRALHG